ncbi:MAG: FAD:protein FMN transferase [Syntrophomonas sp.]
MRKVLFIITLCFILIFMAGCQNQPSSVREYGREDFVMDTLIQVKVCSSDPELAQKALDETFAEFTRISNLSDRFAVKNLSDPEISDVYRINKNAGLKPVQVSDDTLAMLEKSIYYAGLTGGTFDVTVGPVMDLWGFGQAQFHIPSDLELEQKLALVGYKRIVADKAQKTVFLPDKGMEIDLGGIVKGYATDRAAQKLREMGIKSALINAGGNIYALGSKPDGSLWTAGIQDPRNNNRIIAVLRIKDAAAVTSGDYERYFIRDGVRYHHILDPSTGKPARKAISTTIVSPSAVDADVMSTALFVLGPGEGAEFIKKSPHTGAVFVDDQLNITYSPELANQIEFEHGGGYKINTVTN